MNQIQETMTTDFTEKTTTSEERTWAAIAHASSILTLMLAFPTMGLGGLLTVFIPLAIYLMYKDKSEYVAYHAAQAFALQIIGSVGYFVAIIAAIIVWVLAVVLVSLLSVILIGLILIPVLILLTIALIIALLAAPFVFSGFSLVAAVQTAGGEDYRYPYVGRWTEQWLERSQQVETPPAV